MSNSSGNEIRKQIADFFSKGGTIEQLNEAERAFNDHDISTNRTMRPAKKHSENENTSVKTTNFKALNDLMDKIKDDLAVLNNMHNFKEFSHLSYLILNHLQHANSFARGMNVPHRYKIMMTVGDGWELSQEE